MNNAIILMGIKHSGKSTLGRMFAQINNLIFCDLDDIILEISGKTARQVYLENGEQGFKECEKNACLFVLSKIQSEEYKNTRFVISTGGGICDNNQAIEILRQIGSFYFLDAEEEVVVNRIIRKAYQNEFLEWQNLPAYISKKNPGNIQDIKNIFHDFYLERTKKYRSIAHKTISIKDTTKKENLDALIEGISL